LDRLSHIQIPGVNAGQGEGSAALISQDFGQGTKKHSGRVIRLLAELEPVGRMAQILVEVKNPLGGSDTNAKDERNPLILGANVRVNLLGAKVENVVTVPRRALREDDVVWLLSKDSTLVMQKVQVIWRRQNEVIVRGLAQNVKVILSPIPGAVKGMAIQEETKKKKTASAKSSVVSEEEKKK